MVMVDVLRDFSVCWRDALRGRPSRELDPCDQRSSSRRPSLKRGRLCPTEFFSNIAIGVCNQRIQNHTLKWKQSWALTVSDNGGRQHEAWSS